jgi:undecaprenyl-diphosphatase
LATRLTLASVLALVAGLAASAFVLWAFTELAEDVADGESRAFDRTVLFWIHTNAPHWLDGPMLAITTLGYYWVVLSLCAAFALLFYRKGWKLSAALLAVSTAGGMVLTTLLKATFRRVRPELFDSGYTASFFSFPSGHATVAVGFYGMLTVILAYHSKGIVRWLVVALGVLLVLLIGFSRLYLGVHYPTDILAGYLASPLWLLSVGAVYALWISVRGLKTAERRR